MQIVLAELVSSLAIICREFQLQGCIFYFRKMHDLTKNTIIDLLLLSLKLLSLDYDWSFEQHSVLKQW